MKKFIGNILICLAILISINVFFNFLIWKNYYKDYSEINLNYETYLLGDSHGKALADNMENKGVFNFSAVSDSYFDMHRKINFLIQNSKVKKIILTVDDHTLSKYREGSNNLDRSVIYSTAADFDSYVDFIKDRYLKRYIAFSNSKSRDLLKALFISTLKSSGGKMKKKKVWNELTEQERFALADKRAAVQFPGKQQSAALISQLDQIISLCHKNKIELIGIKFPLSGEYYSLVGSKSYNADSLFLRKGLFVSDFTTIFKDNPDYFADQDHLNETGSKKFCAIMINHIDNR